jgi:putative membrane-bound dehydrogenase-like protein
MSQQPLLSIFLVFLLSNLLVSCANDRNAGSHPGEDHEIRVPDGFTVEVAAGPDLVDYPMFATLDESGRLFVFESIGNVYERTQEAIDAPQFRIKLLVDEDGDGTFDKGTVFADSLSFPQGGVFYKGSLYASSAPDLLRLTDTDGDGIADERKVLLSGWILNVNANSLIGPFMGPDGWLYLTSAIEGFEVTTKEGDHLKGETARIWRLRPDGSGLEWVAAGGMNNPVELTFTPAGEVLGTLTFFVDPQRGLRDALSFWVEGGVYGKKNSNITRDRLPLTGDLLPVVAQYSRVAPAGVGLYRNTLLGEDFRNNLFSAQFNTHRVIRHRLFREGASFRTEDELFLWTGNEDFHPTDVLEAGDGSLLVVETGGWFIKGCPLSQVSKPQLKGSIYRIRPVDAAETEDPYGNKIAWETLEAGRLTALMEDPRPFVNDRAAEALIDRGAGAIDGLTDLLHTSSSADARARAVFALYRIGSPESLAAVRKGLADAGEQVRLAAVRSLGLAKHREALPELLDMLKDDSPAVRRQAATALGQIGDPAAFGPLLEAAVGVADRFIQHAIIYSLISLDRPGLVAAGLDHPDPEVRKVALIAMDQSAEAYLKPEHLTPFLAGEDAGLQRTGLWVATHHPEWSAGMIGYMEGQFAQGYAEKQDVLGELLVSFCGQKDMQAFVARQLEKGDAAFKRFLLEKMAACPQDPFPGIWTEALAAELRTSGNADVKSAVIDLVRLRRLAALSDQILQEADDPNNPATLRIKAIGALVENRPDFSDSHFAYLLEELKQTEEAPLRQQIILTLDNGRLAENQLSQIAGEYLPRADHFILPRLAPLFKESHRLETGQALAKALQNSPNLDNFTEAQIRGIFAEYPEAIQAEVEQLAARLNEARSERLARLREIESTLQSGDEARGRALYFGKATCWTCHTMGEEGGNLGPDLTSIQKDRSRHDILEAILYPSVSFVREFETYQITTSANTYTGIIHEQSPQAIVLGIGPETSVRIPREDIKDITLQDFSLMPQALAELLTEQELADLMAFLIGNDLIY